MKNDLIPDEHSPRSLWITQWCLRIITLAFFLQMSWSINLWIPIERSYPKLPFFSFFPVSYHHWLTGSFSIVFLIGLLLASISLRWRQPSLLLSLTCFFLLILEDINRFQPWAYIYTSLLLSIAWYNWRGHPKRQVSTLQFVLVMVYFWSGAHKLNVQFVNDVFPWLVEIFEPTSWLSTYPNLGYGVGIFEIVIGILLVQQKTRRGAVLMGTALHIGILILLIADDWNSIVYPWNAAMIALLFILFWDTKTIPCIINVNRRPNWLILLLFGILPFFYLFKLTPSWIALSLYSGTTMEGDLVIQKTGLEDCIPAPLHSELLDYGQGRRLLSIDTWGLHNLNIPPIASNYTYRAVARHFCECAVAHEGYVVFYYPNKWKNKDRREIITCEELLKQAN